MPITAALSELIDCSSDPIETFNAFVYQITNDSDKFECETVEGLGTAINAFAKAERQGEFAEPACCSATADLEASSAELRSGGTDVLGDLECSKAAREAVTIVEGGKEIHIKIPRNTAEVKADVRRDAWLAASKKAFEVIVRTKGNRLRTQQWAKESGLVAVKPVTARDIKYDKATRSLEKLKARHAWDQPRATAIDKKRGVYVEEPSSSTTADGLLVKATIGHAAATARACTKVDCPNAYLKAKRKRGVIVMQVPEDLKDDPDYWDENGELMVLEIAGSACWGESGAGRDWQATLHTALTTAGYEQAENVPCLYFREMEDGHDARVITIVDDLLITEANMKQVLIMELIASLNEYFEDEMTYEHEPSTFNGQALAWDRARGLCTMRMNGKIEEAVGNYAPEILDPAQRARMGLLQGKQLDDAISKLKLPPAAERKKKVSKEQSAFRSVNGVLRWIEQDMPGEAKAVHGLSRVASFPPEGALQIALAVLARVYDNRMEGITLGRVDEAMRATITTSLDMTNAAPEELAALADATWGDDPVYGLILTAFGASIYHTLKRLHLLVDSSTESEAVATGKAGEMVEYAREVFRGLGIDMSAPTVVGTDNRANLLLSSGEGAPTRMRHAIRRFKVFTQRVATGACVLIHTPDNVNAADFLTKYVGKDKYKASRRYATGAGPDGSRTVRVGGAGWGDN